MNYEIELMPKAEKDLRKLHPEDRARIIERLRWLEQDLRGDVKHLSNHHPEYRMRSGNHRVLFEVEVNRIIVYRILPRGEAYR
jgi:mRNA-degrading endonuclease RelE of RelBE toxin-antitoxin system